MERVDFRYEVSDDRLRAYRQMPVLDRLKWLDDVRRFTLMVRAAPAAAPRDDAEAKQAPPPGSRA
ncbi:MAG: hypothetical protein ACM3Y9_01775 [Ignavibacteria bacterium]